MGVRKYNEKCPYIECIFNNEKRNNNCDILRVAFIECKFRKDKKDYDIDNSNDCCFICYRG